MSANIPLCTLNPLILGIVVTPTVAGVPASRDSYGSPTSATVTSGSGFAAFIENNPFIVDERAAADSYGAARSNHETIRYYI